MKDFYAILEVQATATQEEIIVAYKKKIKQYHPDLNKAVDALEKTKEINEAYATLSNVEKRQMYDAKRNPFDRTPQGFPQGVRVTYTPQSNRNNIVIMHTPSGTQIFVNGVRVQ